MTDQPKKFVHAAILEAWMADPEGVKIECYSVLLSEWHRRHYSSSGAPPNLLPANRYRAVTRCGDVIESPEPEWKVVQLKPNRCGWIVERERYVTGAIIYNEAPDAEATAHMIAARWNGEGGPDRPHIPEGYEYMPGAILPKPLTLEEARSRDVVYRMAAVGDSCIEVRGRHASGTKVYYATRGQAHQVFDAQWRREQ